MAKHTLYGAALAALTLTGGCAASHQDVQPRALDNASRTVEATAPVGAAQAPAPLAAEPKRGQLPINGVNYYYEIHGKGAPLLLLHGGLGSIDMFGPVLVRLAESRQVIGVDLHGHGRTDLGDREISAVDMARDLNLLLERLGYAKVDVAGYSLGGAVALRVAVQHPERVRRLVVISAGFAQTGFYPEMLPLQASVSGAMADAMKDTPMYRSYAAVAPHPEDFPKLLDRMGAYMRTSYDWSDEVRSLKVPTMLVYGDADMYRPEHVVEFYRLLGGGRGDAGWGREHMSQNRLSILPNLTHYEIFMAPELATTILPFLHGEQKALSWSESVGD